MREYKILKEEQLMAITMVRTVFLPGVKNNFRFKGPLNVPLQIKDACFVRVITHMPDTEDMSPQMLTQSNIDNL